MADGSIPAGAGKPECLALLRWHGEVDPRGRGETALNGSDYAAVTGRSPRARGNRVELLLYVLE